MLKSAVIFDFDCTLTTEHMYYFYANGRDGNAALSRVPLREVVSSGNTLEFIRFFFGGEERLRLLKRMLSELAKTSIIYVSTMGIVEDVKIALDITGLTKYFCCGCQGGVYNSNKAKFIRNVYNAGYNIYYIDDSANFIPKVTVPIVYFGGSDYADIPENPNIKFINVGLDREMYGINVDNMRVITKTVREMETIGCFIL